jgi:hypothetical protein
MSHIPPQTLSPELYTCFDKNMEKRVFNSRQSAENVAVGPVEEYVKISTVMELLERMGSSFTKIKRDELWQLLMPCEADDEMVIAAQEHSRHTYMTDPPLGKGKIERMYQAMRESWETRHPSAFPAAEQGNE